MVAQFLTRIRKVLLSTIALTPEHPVEQIGSIPALRGGIRFVPINYTVVVR